MCVVCVHVHAPSNIIMTLGFFLYRYTKYESTVGCGSCVFAFNWTDVETCVVPEYECVM